MAVFAGEVSGLIFIADEKGFFKQLGLDVAIKEYEIGASAVHQVIIDEADLATGAAFLLTLDGFRKQALRALACIATGQTVEVVARKDYGIKKPEDLRGRKIGVTMGTVAPFFLGQFLAFHGVPTTEVHMVDVSLEKMAESIGSGVIDAACTIEPFVSQATKRLGENAVIWNAQGAQRLYYLLLSKEEFTRKRSQAVERILRALIKAEEFARNEPDAAMEITGRRIKYDREALKAVWPRITLQVRLDQAMLTLMEDQGRWAMNNGMVPSGPLPNYFRAIYLRGLENVKPDAVSIIR
jgi:NitT/TauT family transport system substrate-binding protein